MPGRGPRCHERRTRLRVTDVCISTGVRPRGPRVTGSHALGAEVNPLSKPRSSHRLQQHPRSTAPQKHGPPGARTPRAEHPRSTAPHGYGTPGVWYPRSTHPKSMAPQECGPPGAGHPGSVGGLFPSRRPAALTAADLISKGTVGTRRHPPHPQDGAEPGWGPAETEPGPPTGSAEDAAASATLAKAALDTGPACALTPGTLKMRLALLPPPPPGRTPLLPASRPHKATWASAEVMWPQLRCEEVVRGPCPRGNGRRHSPDRSST